METATSVANAAFAVSPLAIGSVEAVADRSGALYLLGERMLVVADLHLEKGSSFVRRGVMLPPYDTRETLARLATVIARYNPRRVVALGDSLHDGDAVARMGEAEKRELRSLQAHRDWVWVTGNHDPEIPTALGGEVVADLAVGDVVLRHEPHPGAVASEIAGHLHPVARAKLGAVVLRRPCFAGDGRRLVLPAFGAFTGGLNVLAAAFAALFRDGRMDVRLIGREGVYLLPTTVLTSD